MGERWSRRSWLILSRGWRQRMLRPGMGAARTQCGAYAGEMRLRSRNKGAIGGIGASRAAGGMQGEVCPRPPLRRHRSPSGLRPPPPYRGSLSPMGKA